MILQVGLGVETVEQVAVEVVEAKATDEDLELLCGKLRAKKKPSSEGLRLNVWTCSVTVLPEFSASAWTFLVIIFNPYIVNF